MKFANCFSSKMIRAVLGSDSNKIELTNLLINPNIAIAYPNKKGDA